MTVIEQETDLCTVIVTVNAPTDILSEIKTQARDGLALFKEC